MSREDLLNEYLKRLGTEVNPKLPIRLYEKSVERMRVKFYLEFLKTKL